VLSNSALPAARVHEIGRYGSRWLYSNRPLVERDPRLSSMPQTLRECEIDSRAQSDESITFSNLRCRIAVRIGVGDEELTLARRAHPLQSRSSQQLEAHNSQPFAAH